MKTPHDDFEDLLGDVGLNGTAAGNSAPLINDAEPEQPDTPETGKGAPEPIPALVSEKEMGRILGLGISRVRTLHTEGKLIKPTRGRYDVRASLLTYIEDLRMKASRMGPGAKSSPANSELNREKLRLTKAQADERELKNAAARGDLLDAAEVRERWTSYTVALRQAVLAVGPRVAAQAGLDRTAAATLDAELRLALEQVATEGAEKDG